MEGALTAQQVGTWLSIVVAILVVIKIFRDQGKLDGVVSTKLEHHKASETALWEKVDKLNESNLLTSPIHRELCTDVTENFNRKIDKLSDDFKADQVERAKTNKLLTRLEVIVDRNGQE